MEVSEVMSIYAQKLQFKLMCICIQNYICSTCTDVEPLWNELDVGKILDVDVVVVGIDIAADFGWWFPLFFVKNVKMLLSWTINFFESVVLMMFIMKIHVVLIRRYNGNNKLKDVHN